MTSKPIVRITLAPWQGSRRSHSRILASEYDEKSVPMSVSSMNLANLASALKSRRCDGDSVLSGGSCEGYDEVEKASRKSLARPESKNEPSAH